MDVYWAQCVTAADNGRLWFNASTAHLQPWQLVAYTFSATILAVIVRSLFDSDQCLSLMASIRIGRFQPSSNGSS